MPSPSTPTRLMVLSERGPMDTVQKPIFGRGSKITLHGSKTERTCTQIGNFPVHNMACAWVKLDADSWVPGDIIEKELTCEQSEA